MRHVFRLMIILFVFVMIFLPDISISAKSQKTALVIGNGAYSSSPLRNPVNDATDITSMLKKLGFKVLLKTDANQRAMKVIQSYVRGHYWDIYWGGKTKTDNSQSISFNGLLNHQYKIETVHGEYYYFKGFIKPSSKQPMNKSVLVIEKGSKVRVQNIKEGEGGILVNSD